MSTQTTSEARAQEWRSRFPAVNYLNADYGIKSWLLTKDHKRIGILYLISVTFFFAVGGAYAAAIRLELLTPLGDLMQSHTYNKVFTHHGIMMVFFFLIPVIPATLGNFLVPLMIGAKDLAFPKINLLSWYVYMVGGGAHLLRAPLRRRGHGLDVLRALLDQLLEHLRHARRPRHLHQRLLVDPDGAELHRHRPHDARAGDDVVPPAALHLGALRDEPHHDSGHARHRHHDPAARAGATRARRHLRPGARRRPRALPAPLLVLLAPGRLHHDPARDGRHLGADRHALAQEHLRLLVRRLLLARHRGLRLPRLGPPHVRLRASRSTPG